MKQPFFRCFLYLKRGVSHTYGTRVTHTYDTRVSHTPFEDMRRHWGKTL